MIARWSSYWAFLFAAIGSSVGLGNIWRFPAQLGEHGGGVYLLVYLLAVFLIGLPLVIAEFVIGRRGQANPIHALQSITHQDRRSLLWQGLGCLAMLTGLLVFSFYSVVVGWALFYLMKSISGSFVDMPAEIVQNSYGALLHNNDQMLIWHTVFVLMVILVLARDVRSGLDRAVRWLMPCFIALVVWLCLYASQVGDLPRAISFLTELDFSLVTPQLLVSAVTQALFSLSVGMGVLMMYGAYLNERRSLFTAAGVIVLTDVGLAVGMSLMVFSIVFAFGMEVDAGSGLIFQTLPVAFSQMTEYSVLSSSLFFFLLLLAALTSGLSLLEPIVAWLDAQFSMSRRVAAWLIGAFAWGLGWLSVYSFSDLRFSFYYLGKEYPNGYFDLLLIATIDFLIPLITFCVAIFVGWRLINQQTINALSFRLKLNYWLWLFCTRILTPIIIALVLLIVLFYSG